MITGNPKVIVIDDDLSEASPLLQALAKRKIAYLYFDGSIENLPEKPLSGIRLLFLDIVLGTEGVPDKIKASAISSRVQRLIKMNAPPYFIVFWTKHDEVITLVLDNLKSVNIAPVGYLNFDKITSFDSENVVSDILARIDMNFSDLGAFSYFLDWENSIEQTIADFSDEFFASIPKDDDAAIWSKNVLSSLGKLALAYTGLDKLKNNSDDLKDAFLMLTGSFCDSIQKNIKIKAQITKLPLLNQNLSLELLAKLNTSLFFDFYPPQDISFGNVFIVPNPTRYFINSLEKNIFTKGNAPPRGTKIIGVIITPSCDLACNKFLFYGNKKYLRILYGMAIPVDSNSIKKIDKLAKSCSSSSAGFAIKPFWNKHNGKIYIIIFNYNSLNSIWWDRNNIPKFIFAIKDHLVFDIQSKMANHANRLGNSMLQIE
jgi:hypothetical protein